MLSIGDLGEIRPYLPVENMLLEDVQRLLACVNSQWSVAHEPDAVHHEWNAGDMIEVGMGNKNMIDFSEFTKTEFTHPGAGVNQHITIKQKRGGA